MKEAKRCLIQPFGQRIDSVGQSKRGGVELVCDMDERGRTGLGEWVDVGDSAAVAEASSECLGQ